MFLIASPRPPPEPDRRLRAAYARRTPPRLHALRRDAHALARLGERLRVDAARVAGADHRERGYRADLERFGDQRLRLMQRVLQETAESHLLTKDLKHSHKINTPHVSNALTLRAPRNSATRNFFIQRCLAINH